MASASRLSWLIFSGSTQTTRVTAGQPHQGQAHAGVAGGSFDEGVARRNLAFPFSRVDDGRGQSIFDTAARIEMLALD